MWLWGHTGSSRAFLGSHAHLCLIAEPPGLLRVLTCSSINRINSAKTLTIPENSFPQQNRSYFFKKKTPKHRKCDTREVTFFPPYCPPGERRVLWLHVSPDLISLFLLKIHPKQHFTIIPRCVLRTLLCAACWLGTAVPFGMSRSTGVHLPGEKDVFCCVCMKSNIKER